MKSRQRHAVAPAISYRKRSEIGTAAHGRIDAILKDLRSCSQRLAPLLSTLEDEMHILDRLYYKGCNQHRSALFWRKVEEMRRFGSRVLEVQLAELVNVLRFSFFVTEDVDKQ